MAGRKVTKPGEGSRVKFKLWNIRGGKFGEWKEGVVLSELSSQFTVLGDDGGTYYKFYKDYGTEWRII